MVTGAGPGPSAAEGVGNAAGAAAVPLLALRGAAATQPGLSLELDLSRAEGTTGARTYASPRPNCVA